MIKMPAKGFRPPILTGRNLSHREQEARKAVNMRPAGKNIDSVVFGSSWSFADFGINSPVSQDIPYLFELWQEAGAIRPRKTE